MRVADRRKDGAIGVRCSRCGEWLAEVETREARGKIEHRFQAGLSDLTVDVEARTFEGYGCVFGQIDTYRTTFEPGCFAKSLADWRSKGQWPSFYLQHDWDQLIGAYTEMFEDSKGLFVKGRFIESVFGDHARALVKEKIASGLSIGFVTIAERVEEADDWSKRRRFITEAELWEVSLVERPSVPGSGVTGLRQDMSVTEVGELLVRHGFPPEIATRMARQWDAPAIEAEIERKRAEQARAAQARVNGDLIAMLDGAAARFNSK
ncbi:MAG: HK97 family phage prohead protease [Hyphomonadaceae bacterium]|nr:HK97 family phage prohead protease [Hyphomonadaceae bacterium]